MLPRPFILLLVPLLAAGAEISKEAQALADQVRSLPPEFAADLLLRLADSPLAADPKAKRGWIEDAFLRARSAPSLYPARDDPWSTNRLESLVLQTRAVEAMLPLDPPEALTLFRDLPAFSLPKVPCRERATPDVAPYYQTALALFQRAFSPGDRLDGKDIAFLREQVSALQSPSQVTPVLKLLDQVELSPQTRADLAAAFTAALDRLQGGDREFAASEPLLVAAAVPEIHQPGVLASLRAYIVRQAGGPRCTERIKPGLLPDSATQFNRLISRIDLKGSPVQPITPDEAAPLSDDGAFPPPAAVPSPTAARASEAIRNARYPDALRLIDAWPAEDTGSPFESYRSLLDQPSAVRHAAILSALRFLERGYDRLEDRGRWFTEFRRLLLDRSDPDTPWALDQMVQSRNPVIAAYAAMEKRLGPR